ncbi:anthranilate synthase component I family protein [Streptacidiphilus sp. EB129]|uniref:anthranilate synthase component I family protein n=1 Tax=Streptacidiphilus sp. EB129 TaxID=3156262 RepID=UPI0035113CB7
MTTLLDAAVRAPAGGRQSLPVRVEETRLAPHSPLQLYAALLARGEQDVFLLESLEGPAQEGDSSIVGRGSLAELRVHPGRIAVSGTAPLVRALLVVADRLGLAAAAPPEGAVADAALTGSVNGAVSGTANGRVAGAVGNADDGAAAGQAHERSFERALARPEQVWELLRGAQELFRVQTRRPADAYAFGFLATIGYGAAWHMEELPPRADATAEPDLVLTLFRETLWYDQDSGGVLRLSAEGPDLPPRDADADLADLAALVAALPPLPPVPDAPPPRSVRDSIDEPAYLDRVERCLEHIGVGDIYQIQIGHRIEVETELRPLDVYRRLRGRNPSPYMYLVPRGGSTLIGASPEVLFRTEGDQVVMRPIAGTTPRSGDPELDRPRVEVLRASEKERAEHIMLVDLCRNDIGRVCLPGTLATERLMSVETFSHVFHLVSTVRGTAAPTEDVWSVLRATFPAGTVTGAPKIRAMELIQELEPQPRGMYAGAVGLVDSRGWSMLALCIRTVVHDGAGYSTQSCAGVVADSDPRAEWRETLHKMGAAYWALTGEELLP